KCLEQGRPTLRLGLAMLCHQLFIEHVTKWPQQRPGQLERDGQANAADGEDKIASHPRQRYGYIDRSETLAQYDRKAFEIHAISLPSGLGSPLRGRSKSTMYKLLPTSGSQRLRSPRIPSTSAVTPASSATSRMTACSTVSSGSINPPGTCQLPRPRREARRTSKSRPSWTTAPPTPTLYPVLYRS